ncbi:hypothetical protein LINPERHAP1_LOCUS39858 [Linum perenne]
MDTMTNQSRLHVRGDWMKLWDLPTPPRVKVMLWRASRDVLPTREALRRRGMNVESTCGICNTLWESPGHLFISCSYALNCWRALGLLNDVERIRLQADSFGDWSFIIIRTMSAEKIQALAAGIGGLWRERNNRVWGEEEKRHTLHVMWCWTRPENGAATSLPQHWFRQMARQAVKSGTPRPRVSLLVTWMVRCFMIRHNMGQGC